MTEAPQPLPLRDIHLPDPISWWPPAPGWWLLVTLSLFSILLGFLYLRRRKQKQHSLKNLAQIQLKHLRQSWEQEQDPQRLVRELSTLLRRICMSLYNREKTACFTGKAWLVLLDQTLEGRRFSAGPGLILAEAPYRRAPQIDAQALIDLCDEWIRALPETVARRSS